MNKLLLLSLLIFTGLFTQAQNATFITIDDANNLSKVTVNATGTCSSTSLNLCSNISGKILSIALNGNLLYLVNNSGDLYSTTLNTSTNCKKLGTFKSSSSQIFGLTVDKNGKVYAANGNQIETYDPGKPAASRFKIVGNVPATYLVGGDLLFYLGQLYMSCKNNVLLAVDTLNPANSSAYLTFSSPNVYGFASVSVACSNNAAYALSTSGSSTNIIGVDMANKIETGTVCNLNYQIYDAASVAESGAYTPPTPPNTNSPINYCENATATALTANAAGTLYWYNTAKGGTGSTTAPTPNTTTVGSITYYVSQKDATGCESERDSIKVIINATNPNPTINITANQTNICAGSTTTFTANITGGTTPTYQWIKNGLPMSGANANTYTPTSLNNNDTIRCTVTSNATCVATPTVASNNILITTISPTVVPLSFDSCKQVTYLGNVYITSTTVKDTVKSMQGCDSIYHNVIINVKQPTTSSVVINTTTPYTWNGTTYTTSGTYTKTGLTNSSGCDSTAKLILTITKNNPCWKIISTGFNHTIAIKVDGTLWAWGQNTYGQVGDGTNINRNMPVQISTDTNWESISAKGFHTVAIKNDGTLWAWGQNSFGQVGDGTSINRSTPVQIGTATNWKQISSGISFTLALKKDNTLWAWGYNILGQLGDGTLINKNTPIQIGTDNNWVNIGAGEFHSTAIKADGTLWTWGSNSNGQLGDGTIISKKVPTQIGTDNNWSFCKGGNAHTIALKTDNTLWSWGSNNSGQLGDGTNINKSTPVQIGIANNWSEINAGGSFSVALNTTGTIWACGKNQYGQLGNGTAINNNSLSKIGVDNNWVSINAGDNHLVASKTDGTVWACGYNLYGQLGDGTNIDKNTTTLIINGCKPCPVAVIVPLSYDSCKQVTYLSKIYTTSTTIKDTVKNVQGCDSIYHNVTITIKQPTTSTSTINTTTPYTWNGTTYTTSGTYTKTGFINSTGCDSTAALILTITPAATNPCWKMITTGTNHTVAIKADGSLWAWGSNQYGQLGDGTNTNKNVPIQIGTDNDWINISAKGYHTLAIKSDGTLWAWGYNSFGQLGDGSLINKNTPVQIGTDNDWADISSGFVFTLALKKDGTIWAWGLNNFGQLGDGTIINKNTPIQIGTDNDWVNIGTGYGHSAAIKADGTLWAWGYNSFGQLGDGSLINKNTPVQIGIDNDWSSFNGGQDHSIALKTDNTLWAWGGNSAGQVGDGTIIKKTTPVQIGIANNWRAINGGYGFSTAVNTGGTIWAWGSNVFGQFGNGTTININIPTQIGNDSNWVNINASDGYIVASKIDGSVWACGRNTLGQLGDGTNIDKKTLKVIINGCTPCPTPTTKTTNLSDCKLVIYKGIPYKVNAVIKDTIKSIAGCDSIYNVVNITISPIVVKTNTAILTSCKTIIYNGIPYNSSTIVRDTIRTSGGCDSIYNITNISITPNIATAKTINLFDCKTVIYKIIPYNASTILHDTIKSVVGCGDSIYYNINITIAAPATTIALPLFDCNSVTYKTKTYTASTSFTDTVKSYQGCDSIYNNVAITIAPATKIIPIPLFDCKSVIYKTKLYTTSSSFTDTIKGNLGCDSIYNNVAITIASPATSIAVPLFGCKSVTYKTKPYLSSTSFIDTVKGKLGCDSIYNNVAITIAPAAISLSINLKDCKSITYNNKLYTSSTAFIDTLKSKQGCDSIYNNVNIVITSLNPTTTKLQYAACNYVNYSGNTYHSSTQILDTFRTATGCDSAYKTVNIKVYPMPTVFASSDVFVLLNNSVVLNPAITNAAKIEWTPAFYLNNYNTDLVTCTPLKDITYKIKTTSKDGCTDSAFQKVFVDKALNIPNVFTPNGDNVNDTWAIDGLRIYPRNIIQIFNRYGQNIFTSSPGNYKPWNGKLNGNDLPVGTYYYILKLTADASPIAGSITILR